MKKCLRCGQKEFPRIRLVDLVSLTAVKEEPLCRKCQMQCVELRLFTTCSGCGRKWEKEGICNDCRRWQQLYPDYAFCNEALYEYNDFIKGWIEQYKFKSDYRYREFFATSLKERIEERIKKGWYVVPIPISQKSMANRGFNQVNGILDFARIPYTEVLVHIGTGAKQSTKNRKERMTSPQPFTLREEQKEFIDKKRLLLVDDVYTTGRTLFHAADCLLANGAAEIQTITIAR